MTFQQSWHALYGEPTVQKRVSIARPPAPFTEDSDVLVLNSRSTSPDASSPGAKVLYLDLRLSLPITESSKINWAFAGLRETVPLDEPQETAVRYRWKHAIDSHGPGEPPDEGTMVERRDESGESVEVETGVGIDPVTGKVGPYEEVWKSESVRLGTPFAFLVSHVDPDQSTGFVGILGLHAMGLCRLDAVSDQKSSSIHDDEPQRFHAVRLRIDSENLQSHPAYSKVFSTGYQTLDNQVGKLGEELMAREREGKRLWRRGERLTLRDNQGRAAIWTVWDVGHVN